MNFHDASGDTSAQIEILANVIYSYETVKNAAESVFNRDPKWKQDRLTKRLQFTDKWVKGFLGRLQFMKRRVTTTMKILPPVNLVQARMNEIKECIVRQQIPASRIFNADETGVNWSPELKHQFVPKNAIRAVSPPGDESGRFTAMLGANACGDLLPYFLIVKCSCKSTTDLTKSTILRKFLGEGKVCQPSDGWVSNIWTKTLTIKGTPTKIFRPYLFNTHNFDLITVQSRAWNDTAGCLMWIEIQLKAYKVSSAMSRYLIHRPDPHLIHLISSGEILS